MGPLHVLPPSVDTLTATPLGEVSLPMSNTSEHAYTTVPPGPNATTGSEARIQGPAIGFGASFVSPGSSPNVQVLPPSNVVANPLAWSPAALTRPSWYTATALLPP